MCVLVVLFVRWWRVVFVWEGSEGWIMSRAVVVVVDSLSYVLTYKGRKLRGEKQE